VVQGESVQDFCGKLPQPPVPHTHVCKLLARAGVVGFVGLGGTWPQGFQILGGCGYFQCLRLEENQCLLGHGGSLAKLGYAPNAKQARRSIRKYIGKDLPFQPVNVGANLAAVVTGPTEMAVRARTAVFTLVASGRDKSAWDTRDNILKGARRIAAALR
jgi:hypothetical protein